jgi:hypothetical protein
LNIIPRRQDKTEEQHARLADAIQAALIPVTHRIRIEPQYGP